MQQSPNDSARDERQKEWYKQLLYYRANPDTLEFSYMVLANPNDVVYRPYDLLVVSHAKVQREFYYTMSAEGVTHFYGSETSHMPLDEFERSYFMYRQVSEMRFFSRFRLWKAFRLWRAYICRRKADIASQYLIKRLFHLHGCFGPCLQALVRTCDALQQGTTFTVLAADQPHALDELKARRAVAEHCSFPSIAIRRCCSLRPAYTPQTSRVSEPRMCRCSSTPLQTL